MSKIKKVLRRFNESAGLSTVTVLATAAGAITMTLITTKLISSGSSLLITGLISSLAVIINGFYKAIISSMGQKTKNIVLTANEVLNDAPDESYIGDGEIEDLKDPTPIEEVDENLPNESNLKKFFKFIKKNNFWILLMLFVTISLVTLGLSQLISKADVVHVHNYETTEVTEVQKETLDEDSKQDIVNDVLNQVDSNSPVIIEGPQSDTVEDISNLGPNVKTIEEQLLDSLARIDSLEGELKTALDTINSLQEQLKTNDDKMKLIEEKLKLLESNTPNTDLGTPDSVTSPTL